jgi:phosphoribosylcarboxyaminoimidazole (NCAIR) mutase
MRSRRQFVKSLCAGVPVFSINQLLAGTPLGVQFINVARQAGLNAETIFGAENRNKYLLETTGCGVALID